MTEAAPVAAPAPAPDLAAAAPPAPVPATVEYKLTAPKDSGFDDAYLKGASEFAGKHKLSNDQAQALLQREHERAAASSQAYETTKAGWLTALKADFKATEYPDAFHDIDVAVTALVDKHARASDKEAFVAWLKSSGAIYYPPFFHLLNNIASAGKEKPLVRAGATPADGTPWQVREYPNTPAMWPKDYVASLPAEQRAALRI